MVTIIAGILWGRQMSYDQTATSIGLVGLANSLQAATSRQVQGLASGVATIQENPANYALSVPQQTQVTTLAAAQSNVSLAMSAIGTAQGALTSVTSLLQQAQSVATQALSAPNSAILANDARQFDKIANQINAVVSNASFNGINLVSANPSSMQVYTTGSGGRLTVNGAASDAKSLGLPSASTAFGNSASIQAAIGATNNALAQVIQTQATYGGVQGALQAAQAFNQSESLTASQSAAGLTGTDVAAEVVQLTTLKMQTEANVAAQKTSNSLIRDLLNFSPAAAPKASAPKTTV